MTYAETDPNAIAERITVVVKQNGGGCGKAKVNL